MTYPFGRGWARSLPYVGLFAGMSLYLIFGFGPSLATAILSLTDISGVPGQPFHFIGLQNYGQFLFAPDARDNVDALVRTIVFSVSVTALQTILALLIAVLLNAKLRGRTSVRALVFMPVILGVTVVGLTWQLVLNPIGGPMEQLINLVGVSSPLLGSDHAAFPWVIAIQVWSALGYATVIFLAGLQTIPGDLYEAASIDGRSGRQSFRYVTYPLLAPTITINALLAIIGSLQTFQIIYVLTNGQHNTSTLGLHIFQTAFFGDTSGGGGAGANVATLRQGYASALSMIQFLFVLVVAVGVGVYLRRREVQL